VPVSSWYETTSRVFQSGMVFASFGREG